MKKSPSLFLKNTKHDLLCLLPHYGQAQSRCLCSQTGNSSGNWEMTILVRLTDRKGSTPTRVGLVEVGSGTTFRDVWKQLGGKRRKLMDILIRTHTEQDIEVGNAQIDARVRRFLERFSDPRIIFEIETGGKTSQEQTDCDIDMTNRIFDNDNVLVYM